MTEDTRMILKELSKVNERLDKVDNRLDKMDDRFDRMDERFDKMDQRVDNLEKTTKGELRAIKMYLENEIEPKISIVAEGHIDLMRKFRKIQVCKEEWEMMKMRVLALERGVREIKAKMDVA